MIKCHAEHDRLFVESLFLLCSSLSLALFLRGCYCIFECYVVFFVKKRKSCLKSVLDSFLQFHSNLLCSGREFVIKLTCHSLLLAIYLFHLNYTAWCCQVKCFAISAKCSEQLISRLVELLISKVREVLISVLIVPWNNLYWMNESQFPLECCMYTILQ